MTFFFDNDINKLSTLCVVKGYALDFSGLISIFSFPKGKLNQYFFQRLTVILFTAAEKLDKLMKSDYSLKVEKDHLIKY